MSIEQIVVDLSVLEKELSVCPIDIAETVKKTWDNYYIKRIVALTYDDFDVDFVFTYGIKPRVVEALINRHGNNIEAIARELKLSKIIIVRAELCENVAFLTE